jgi:hypothetical protein
VQADRLYAVLQAMPLHLSGSDQAGKQGTLIFDPKGTNAAINAGLRPADGWASNVPLPQDFTPFGLAVDFVNQGLLVEAQFSNYPGAIGRIV